MSQVLGKALKTAREKLDRTQQAVANHVGVSRAAVGQWEKGEVEPSTEHLIKVCDFFGISLSDATKGVVRYLRSSDAQGEAERPPANEVAVTNKIPVQTRSDMPSDVPVKGIAVGGADADFYLNGEIVDYIRRPIGIRNARDVYVIYVIGDSMSPRFEPGEIVYINPARLPVPGDYVVVQLQPESDGEPIRAFIKRLKKRGPPTLVLEQFNPEKTISIDSKKVLAMHRVVPWSELLGS